MRKIIFTVFIIFGLIDLNAQFWHFGVQVFSSPKLDIQFFQYNKSEYVFYFANEQNETIRFDGIDTSRVRAMNPYPSIYLRYDFNLRWYIQADLFYFWFRNEATYRNSVDYTYYVNSVGQQLNTNIFNYSSLQLKWRFSGFRVIYGYVFNKTKSLRPFIFSGFSIMYLSDFRIGDQNLAHQYRNVVIFKHLSTFLPFTFYNTSGFGIKYRGFALTTYSFYSTGNIDVYAKEYKNNHITSLETPHPNYKYIQGGFVSLSINLFSKNVSKKYSKL